MEIKPLSEFIEMRLAQAAEHPYTEWKEEATIWAIQDYLSMKGEFSTEDLKTLYSLGFCGGDFIDGDYEEEVVACDKCGYEAVDTEGDVISAGGCCPVCGKPNIYVYGRSKK